MKALNTWRVNAGLITATFLQLVVVQIRNTTGTEYLEKTFQVPSTISRIVIDDKHQGRIRIAWQYKT